MMKNNKLNLYEECRNYPQTFDVAVLGGGTAGSIAAIAAAMYQAETVVIERECFLGGTASGGQVTPMMSNHIPGNLDNSFISRKVNAGLLEQGYADSDIYGNDGWFNPEMLKFTLEDMLLQNGGKLLYGTELIYPVLKDGIMEGVVVHNRGGLQFIKAKVFIDATGDAALSYKSGVPCFEGSEENGRNQPMSLRFMLGNIDIKKVISFLAEIGICCELEYPFLEIASLWSYESPLTDIFRQGVRRGVIEYNDASYFQAFTVPGMPGVMSFNCPEAVGYDRANDSGCVTNAVVECRGAIRRLHNFLKEYIEGFESSYIISVASMPGIRESRRIKGQYVLTEEDYNHRRKFADAIAQTGYPIDIHGENQSEGKVKPFQRGEYFEVPFRCLVPENIANLLAAGRCISSSFVVQSCIRIQPTCRAMGEAAGIAAAMSCIRNISVGEIDGMEIRKAMIQNGAEFTGQR